MAFAPVLAHLEGWQRRFDPMNLSGGGEEKGHFPEKGDEKGTGHFPEACSIPHSRFPGNGLPAGDPRVGQTC